MAKTSKTYAVTHKGGVIGDVHGIFDAGRVACAGAVTIEGSPVNKFGVQLSLNKGDLEKAIDLPRFRRMEKNGEVFVMNYYNTLEDDGE